jgi:glycosyltransferase involved in cell wall biosynthesis
MSIVSNGFQKFHLAALASELDRRGALTAMLTGGYPTPAVKAVVGALQPLGLGRKGWSRLLARGEQLNARRVSSHWIGEAVYQLGAHFDTQSIRTRLMAVGMEIYSRSTARYLERLAAPPKIFHYRSGFGGEAVEVARRLGMVVVCDHSIVHPAFIDGLIRDGGQVDTQMGDISGHPYWSRVVADCDTADAIIVNSGFVRDSFLASGFDPSLVHTIYLGVDDAFLAAAPADVSSRSVQGPLRLMFGASLCDRRKGTHDLLEACRSLHDLPLELRIAGAIPADVGREYRDVLESPAARLLGVLSRKDLAQEMAHADAFVCPSLAEGSARVIFEAMACGSYIITTPNIHGQVIPPGDPAAIAGSIRSIHADRQRVHEIGTRNSALVRNNYLQRHYGAAVSALYEKLLRERAAISS